jgi:hypothetical protein
VLTAQSAIAIVLGGDEGDVENAFDEGRARSGSWSRLGSWAGRRVA